ncbi:MAG TPA: hypothetical protein H9761_08740 [Candidatus Eisenbergiella merdavium]|uniref:Uncharacterized protein n=1 Tax=Candidatus Eisenbergiella merdavium TaxID=2838551 RepID=A0A9D2SR28_9FIRM|nr:hypothetical protein [Candidatus Eisenbergiella merdavium]
MKKRSIFLSVMMPRPEGPFPSGRGILVLWHLKHFGVLGIFVFEHFRQKFFDHFHENFFER